MRHIGGESMNTEEEDSMIFLTIAVIFIFFVLGLLAFALVYLAQ